MSKTMNVDFRNSAIALQQLSDNFNISREAILEEAIELLLWAISEKMDGRRICSVEAVTVADNCLIKEFAEGSNGYMYESPLLSKVSGHIYRWPPF